MIRLTSFYSYLSLEIPLPAAISDRALMNFKKDDIRIEKIIGADSYNPVFLASKDVTDSSPPITKLTIFNESKFKNN